MSISQEIKSRLDLVEIVEEYLPLRKSGSSYSGFCPFHPNTRTPAFVVFPESQTWRCFGACAEGGDVFSFVMKKEGWDFKEALRHLAERAGVELTPLSPRQQARQEVEDRLALLLDAAADYFHQLMLYAPQAEKARAYVADRQLSEETLATFRVGFALDSWDACRTHFLGQGYVLDELLEAGLLSKNDERGTTYDRFRDRLMIPIQDVSGRTVGFGARTLAPDGIPKYLNSPQTTLFDKSRLLFGLDTARRHIREARQAVIVEGYMDVMQAHQHGFRNVVAQMGTALTEPQLALLKRTTKRFVLALDADEAGAQATLRSLEVARQALDREAEVGGFDPRGLIRHEGRLQADIRIVTLPAGRDPDQIIRDDPGRWPALVAEARPVVAYVIDTYVGALDPGDAKAKTEAAAKILPLIGDVADPVEREHYRQHLARALGVDERALRKMQASERPARGGPARSGARPVDPHAGKTGRPPSGKPRFELGKLFLTEQREIHYLRQVLGRPHLLSEVDDSLRRQEQPAISESDFGVAEDRMLFGRLRGLVYAGGFAGLDDLSAGLDHSSAQRLAYLLDDAVETSLAGRVGPTTETADSLALSMLNCRAETIRQQMNDLKQLMSQPDREQHAEVLATIGQMQTRLLAIDRARAAMLTLNRRRSEERRALRPG